MEGALRPAHSAWRYAALGLALAVGLSAVFIAYMWLFGGQLREADGALTLNARSALVIGVLISFLITVHAHENATDDFAELRRRLGWSDEEFRGLVRGELPTSARRLWLYRGIGVLIGIGMIPASSDFPSALLEPVNWDAGLFWSLATNSFLFGLMATTVHDDVAGRGADERIAAELPMDDLLDRTLVEPFARQGLRKAFYWAGGSSIASLLFLELEAVWALVAIIAGTWSLATLSFLSPALAIRRRVAQAKALELERVRGVIRRAKENALGGAGTPGAAELPGLLGWESRLREVREWPHDLDSRLRFAGLLSLAVASWLGGALVERILEVIWS